MQFPTVVSPHLPPINSVSRVMLQVLLAMTPGIMAIAWFFGAGVIINLAIAIITALISEASILILRNRPVLSTLNDLSAVVTAALLAVALPVIAPWWLTVIGTLFAIVIVKHLYGGLGYNPFNPAMAGYVLLLVSFPLPMTSWPTPLEISTANLSWLDFAALIFLERLPEGVSFDAVTLATPLDTIRTGLGLKQNIASITASSPVFGYVAGTGWEWIALAYLLGGLWLLWRKVIGWQIPVGFLVGLSAMAAIFFVFDNQQFSSPGFHLFAGATMLGAFFIATDPVTAATSVKGRIIYGLLIGILVYIIRVWGGYPDAVAFAVLLANLAVPTIDYFTRPRIFGQRT